MPRVVHAQSGSPREVRSEEGAVVRPGAQESTESIVPEETIVVTGRRMLNSLVQEGADLTEDLYMRLNVVLDDPDFRISCGRERTLGTRLSTRVCRAAFQQRLRNRQAISILQSIAPNENGELYITNWTGTVESVEAEAAQHYVQFWNAVLDAVNSDPLLNRQFNRLLSLQTAIDNYESPRERRRRLRNEEAAADDGN
jgi:hypothetical protein